VVGAFVLWLCASAAATVLVPATLAELSREAYVIVRGQVLDTEVVTTGDWKSIETIVTLAPEEALKGPVGGAVRFRTPGGQVGRYRRMVIGAPEFRVGQRVVVFLNNRGAELPYVIGMTQGVFRLVERNGQWFVTPPPALARRTQPQPMTRGDLARRPLLVAEFEREVRALVRGAR
jgi:hypothetical protein